MQQTVMFRHDLPAGAIGRWLTQGWGLYRRSAGLASAFTTVFAALGGVLVGLLLHHGYAPLLLGLAGGFMLVAPCLTPGFFALAAQLRRGEAVSWNDIARGYRAVAPAIWLLAGLAAFFSMIWFTDAAIQYGLFFGSVPFDWAHDLASPRMLGFLGFSGVTGGVLAAFVYVVNVFAVPLLYHRRANVAKAIGASVRACFAHARLMLLWGALLAVSTILTMLLFFPAFVIVFPVLAYASDAAYREVFDEPPY